MSRTPADSASYGFQAYRAGWQALSHLLRTGRSLSGRQPNCAFLNCGRGAFANISAVSGLDFPDDARALAVVDWDHDGDLDLWLGNRTGPRLRLMRNRTHTPAIGQTRDFVTFKLRGRRCHRDAIGARIQIELDDPSGRTLMQTLYAGDGYLSQSSKWVHFGLGKHRQINHVQVSWPGGQTERFNDVQPGRHYVLVQDSGKAVEWSRPSTQDGGLKLTEAVQAPPESSSTAAIFLPSRLPLPTLHYKTFADTDELIDTQSPLLLHFWASWCSPCIEELKTMKTQANQLQNAGLKVLSVTVDGFDPEKWTQASDAKRLLDRISYPFDAGVATAELLDKMEIVQTILFHGQAPLAVPVSFLIDRDGALAATYRGPIDLDLILADAANLAASAQETRKLAMPFAGRWASPMPKLNFTKLAGQFESYGEDRVRFLRLGLDQLADSQPLTLPRPTHSEIQRERTEIQLQLAEALREQGELDQAIVHWREAIRLDQRNADAHYDLANVFLAQDKLSDANHHFRAALRIKPDFPEAHNNLGIALRSQGKLADAQNHFRHASRIRPEFFEAYINLGEAQILSGQLNVALESFRESLRLRHDSPMAMNAVAWILATHPDAGHRQPREAIRLAQRAGQLTKHRHPLIMNTLAAAYAADGQFDRAVSSAETALALATNARASQLADQIRKRLTLYRQRKSYLAPVP